MELLEFEMLQGNRNAGPEGQGPCQVREYPLLTQAAGLNDSLCLFKILRENMEYIKSLWQAGQKKHYDQ